jgi:hypothetical protein
VAAPQKEFAQLGLQGQGERTRALGREAAVSRDFLIRSDLPPYSDGDELPGPTQNQPDRAPDFAGFGGRGPIADVIKLPEPDIEAA